MKEKNSRSPGIILRRWEQHTQNKLARSGEGQTSVSGRFIFLSSNVESHYPTKHGLRVFLMRINKRYQLKSFIEKWFKVCNIMVFKLRSFSCVYH